MNKLFAQVYEFFYFSPHFSDDLYREGLYLPVGVACFLSSGFLVFAFYYIINRPAFSRWYHWMIIFFINVSINNGYALYRSQTRFTELGYHYGGEYLMFGMANSYTAALFFIIWTLCIRWWSTNARQTPIPH